MTVAIPTREGAPSKARRYIVEGRLTIQAIHAGRVCASCRGDGEVYDLGYTHRRWWCTCPARTIDCAHLRALRLVVDRPESRP
jgi:hypothetical protein